MRTISRLWELYRLGGITEIKRGVVDTIILSTPGTLLAYIFHVRTLEIDDIQIRFYIRDQETLWRSRGHGELAAMHDLASKIKENDIFWDVGANLGSYTILAEKLGADVHAFEPGSDTRKLLQENLKLNDSFSNIYPIALGSERTERILIQSQTTGNRFVSDKGDGETIQVLPGDDVDVPDPDIIKIDVEGGEMAVLKGMPNRISNCRVCYVECHNSEDEVKIREHLSDYNFTITSLDTIGERILRAEQ